MFGDELRDRVASSGRPVIRATVNGFHNPMPVRYRRGRSSPEGFYRDSYDYAILTAVLLDPLNPGGTGQFRRAVFDVDADTIVDAPEEQASPGSILLFDGLFLRRPELRAYWDYSVLLRYFRECEPWRHASVVIDNDDLAAPFIVSSEQTSSVRIRPEESPDRRGGRARPPRLLSPLRLRPRRAQRPRL
jgi:uridine kinase